MPYLDNWFQQGYSMNGYFDLDSFFKYRSPVLLNDHKEKQTDNRFDPQSLIKGFTSSRVALPIFESIKRQLTSDEFAFYGKSQTVNDSLKELLINSLDLDDILEKICISFWGTGADFISYVENNQIVAKTFFEEGREAIAFTRDPIQNKITKYHILDLTNQERVLKTIPASQVIHLKYANPFNSVIGISPAMILTPLWELKRKIDASQETIYSNGMQAAKLISVKPEVGEAFGQGSGKDKAMYAEQFESLKEEIAQTIGLYNRNKALMTFFPGLQVDDLQLNNSEMRTLEVIDKYIDKQTYITYSQDPSLFDTGLSKYKNAEIMRDVRTKAIEYKIKIITKQYIQNWVMPQIYPNYNAIKYPFEYTKTVTEESLAEETQRNKRDKDSMDFFMKAKSTGVGVDLTKAIKDDWEQRYGIVIKDEHPIDQQEKVDPENSNNEQNPDEGQEVTFDEPENQETVPPPEEEQPKEERKRNLDKATEIITRALQKQLEAINS